MSEKIYLYTDGACSCNPGPAGVGILMKYKEHERRISKFLGDATNNIAELSAIKIALESIKDPNKEVIIYTDSQYAIGVLNNENWKPKKNKELIQEIKKIASRFQKIYFVWVRGHSGIKENEITDQLAVNAYLSREDTDWRNIKK